jgi:DNA-binding FadR family transcriptional regulator
MLEQMKKYDTLEKVSSERKSSREFHSAIAEATKNDLLIKLYAVVANAFPDWLLYEALFRYPELIEGSMASTYQEHVAIVEALKRGDSEESARKSIAHLMESGKWLEEYLGIPAELLREKEEQVSSLMKK